MSIGSRLTRSGFTLVEVVVAAVIVAILAAVAVPQLIDFIDEQQAQTTANILSSLATGIANYAADITIGTAATNHTYPLNINELVTNAAATFKNSCGNSYTQATVTTGWNANAPFVNFNIPSTGYVTPIGTISNTMTRSPSGVATAGTLSMTMATVDYKDAKNLDAIVDGGDGASSGIVQWTPSGATSGNVSVTYSVPIGAKC